MRVRTFTDRGRGIQFVEGSGPIIPRLGFSWSSPNAAARHQTGDHGPDGSYIEILPKDPRQRSHMGLKDDEEIAIWIEDDRKAPARVFTNADELRAIVELLRANGVEIDPHRRKQRMLAWELAKSFGASDEAAADSRDQS